jgi:hypothetical protein
MLYASKEERKLEIQCPLLFKLDPVRAYLRRHMKAGDSEIAKKFIGLYYLGFLGKEIGNNSYTYVFSSAIRLVEFSNNEI